MRQDAGVLIYFGIRNFDFGFRELRKLCDFLGALRGKN